VKEAIWISIGAILGANARYLLGNLIAKALGSPFPFSTLVINMSGSGVLGWFLARLAGAGLPDPTWRLLFAVGFCGTYTTFSTFAYESIALLQSGQWLRFAINVLGTNVLCLSCVALGIELGR
jgi:fluoride exporter